MRYLFTFILLCLFVFDITAQQFPLEINFEWYNQYSSNNVQNRTIILKANHGFLYNVSIFKNATFDMDEFHFTKMGNQDLLLTKLDTLGNIIWVNNLSSISDTAIDLDFDMAGNPILLLSNRLKKIDQNNASDIWTKNYTGYSMCVDSSDNIFIAGNINNTGIHKLNPLGNYLSSINSQNGCPTDITYSPFDNSIIFGAYANNGFIIGAEQLYLDPNLYGQYNWTFVCKYDNNLNFKWIKSNPVKNEAFYAVKNNPKTGEIHYFTAKGSGASYAVNINSLNSDGTAIGNYILGIFNTFSNDPIKPTFFVDSSYIIYNGTDANEYNVFEIIDLSGQKQPVKYLNPSMLPKSVTVVNKSIYIGGRETGKISLGKVNYKYPVLSSFWQFYTTLNLCEMDTIKLLEYSLTAFGGDTPFVINWNPIPSLIDTTFGYIPYQYVDTSMHFTISVSNDNGDTSHYYMDINLADTTIKPTIFASDTLLCDTVILVSSLPFRPGTNDRWLFNGKQLYNKHNDTILVTKPGIYTFVKDNFCFPESRDSIIISSKIDFNISQSPNDSVCIGNPISISGIPNDYSYVWPLNIQSGVPFVANYYNNSYIVTATDSNGCKRTKEFKLKIKNKQIPNLSVSGSTKLCKGDSTTINCIGATTYFCDNGLQLGVPFFTDTSMQITIVGFDTFNCYNVKKIDLIVNNLPIVKAMTIDSQLCKGNAAILYGKGANNYTWTGGVINNQPFYPMQTSTYTVTGIDTNNCSSTDSISINVRPFTAPIINLVVTDSILCKGDSVILFAEGANSISWNNGISNNQTFYPTISSLYTVTVTNSNFCSSTKSIFIEVNPSPIISNLEYDNKNHTINILNNNSNNIKWYYNNIELEDTNSYSLFTKGNGIYFAKATDSNGCFSITEKLLINDNYRDLIVMPNPFHDYISINAIFTNDEVLTFQLYDLTGNIILDNEKQKAIKTGVHSFQINNLDKLSKGIYFLYLVVSEQSYLIKLSKE